MIDKFFSRTSVETLGSKGTDIGLLMLRLASGGLMLKHGIPKLMNYTERVESFADPFGLGSPISLALAIFAEVFCAIAVILGWKVRYAVVPLIITMSVVILHVHWDDPFGRKELPLLFLSSYITLLFTGAGRIAISKS